jgi:hypothetical protein
MIRRQTSFVQGNGRGRWCRFPIIIVVMSAIWLFASSALAVDSDVFDEAYSSVEEWLMSTDGEVAEIHDFEYRKDAATFRFEDGKIVLRRPIDGRPTVAIFIGKGSVSVPVPLHVERQNCAMLSGDSVVQDEFEICYIRFADDLDLELQQSCSFHTGALSANEFRRIKSAQGDYFFKPVPQHGLDNYFQLLRSAFGRSSDGFFWASFGKYVYSFDPTRSEEVGVLYNREPSSLWAYRAARFSREECLAPDSVYCADVIFPTRGLSQETMLEFDGASGWVIASGRSTITVCRERDSAQFASLFLDRRLQVDSAFCDGRQIHFQRRRSFEHVGLVLPEWWRKGDTLSLTLHYHGREYWSPYPRLLNSAGYSHKLNVSAPASYNYPLLGEGRLDENNPDRRLFEIQTGPTQREPQFIAQATGWDTLSTETSWGLPLHYTWPKSNRLSFFREDKKQKMIEQALKFYYHLLGPPCGVDELFVAPIISETRSLYVSGRTGVIRVGTAASSDDLGGYANQAGGEVTRQWLSDCVGLQSYRESWMLPALRTYLKLLFIQSGIGNEPFNYHLSGCRKAVYSVIREDADFPLASGTPSGESEGQDFRFFSDYTASSSKGVWVIHMLRNLMNAVDSERDTRFTGWLNEVVRDMNSGPFSNGDFQRLAEQYFGYDLDWFFKHWLYGTGLPEYDMVFSTAQEDDGYYVKCKIATEGTADDFLMPVLIRIDLPDGPSYNNLFVAAKYQDYRLGPYAEEPISVHFNQYMSVLSRDKVKRVD